jgi:hypothetical protein
MNMLTFYEACFTVLGLSTAFWFLSYFLEDENGDIIINVDKWLGRKPKVEPTDVN